MTDWEKVSIDAHKEMDFQRTRADKWQAEAARLKEKLEAVAAEVNATPHMGYQTLQGFWEQHARLRELLNPTERTETDDCGRQLGCCYPLECSQERRCKWDGRGWAKADE